MHVFVVLLTVFQIFYALWVCHFPLVSFVAFSVANVAFQPLAASTTKLDKHSELNEFSELLQVHRARQSAANALLYATASTDYVNSTQPKTNLNFPPNYYWNKTAAYWTTNMIKMRWRRSLPRPQYLTSLFLKTLGVEKQRRQFCSLKLPLLRKRLEHLKRWGVNCNALFYQVLIIFHIEGCDWFFIAKTALY